MKNIFNTLLLVFLVTSCSKDDDPVVYPTPTPEIPADKKMVETIDSYENDLAFSYYPDKKVEHAWVGHHTMYTMHYEGNKVTRITYQSADRQYHYDFSYNGEGGRVNGYLVYDYVTGDLITYVPLVYDAATMGYNNWLYTYPDGTVRKAITDVGERVVVYDTSKKGALRNANWQIVFYMMVVERNQVFWPLWVGPYAATQIIYPQGVMPIDNTYDSQGFLTASHIDSSQNDHNTTYNYIEL